jgi:hypothetical protein
MGYPLFTRRVEKTHHLYYKLISREIMVALGKRFNGVGGLQQHGGKGAHWADRLASFDSHSIF